MKRTTCMFLLPVLALLLMLCCGAAQADGEVTSYDLYVLGVRVTSANQGDIFGDGKASFDPETNTLTLNDPSRSGAVYTQDSERIKIFSTDMPLNLRGSYHMTETDVAYGLVVQRGQLTVDGDFTFRGTKRGIISTQGMTVSGGSVTALGEEETGVSVLDGSLILEGGSFSATGGNRGVHVSKGYLTLHADIESAYFQGYGYSAIYAYWGILRPESDTRQVRIAQPARGYFSGMVIRDPDYIPPHPGEVYIPVTSEDEFARVVRIVSDRLYGISLGNVRVTTANAGNILGDGRASYDPDTRTLTLNEPNISGFITKEIGGYSASHSILATGTDQLTVKGQWHMSETQADFGIRVANGSLILDGSFAFKGNIAGICADNGLLVRNGGLYAYGGEIGAVAGSLTMENTCGYVELESGSQEPGMFDARPVWPAEYSITSILTGFRNDQTSGTAHYSTTNKYVARQLDTSGFMTGDVLQIGKIRITDIRGFEGAGSENDPYRISSVEDWNRLAEVVEEDAANLSVKHFALMKDLTVTTMIGSFAHPFSSNFNGRGNRLTFNYTASEEYCAPFRHVGNATIRNLRTDGLITTSRKYAAGVVSDVIENGSCRIVNCESNVEIHSGVAGDGTHGGFVATGSNVSMTGCAFNGAIIGTNTTLCAGFQGWDRGGSSVSYCVFNGLMDTQSGTATFIRNRSAADHCYYNRTRAIGQGRDYGKAIINVSSGWLACLAIDFGESQVYDVSGITAYSGGLGWTGGFCAGEGDRVSMRFVYRNPPAGTRIAGQYASAGVLTEGENDTWTLTIPNESVQIHPFLIPKSGSGTSDDPYGIGTAEDWDLFASAVGHGFSTSGRYFALTQSISVTTMMGTQTNLFAGTFDGQGNTLSFQAENTDSDTSVAPFAWTGGATIRDLHVTGAVTGNKGRASGLIGENRNAVSRVNNCRVSMSVSGTYYIAGFLVGEGPGVQFTGCVFDGSIRAENGKGGGFAGWSEQNSGLRFTDCLVITNTLTESSAYYYDNYASGTQVLTNSYSRTAAGIAQGRQAFFVSGDEGVTADFGTPVTAYNVSGITTYAAGLKYGGVFYAGAGDNVAVSLEGEAPEGFYVYGFDCNAGTLAGSGNPRTLTMPGGDVTIRMLSAPIFNTPDFTLPAGLTEIGEEAFAGAKMRAVVIPDGVGSIGTHAFRNCGSLTQIRIPAECALGTDVFDGCTLVYVYGAAGSPAEDYCSDPNHGNCIFVQE